MNDCVRFTTQSCTVYISRVKDDNIFIEKFENISIRNQIHPFSFPQMGIKSN